MYLPKRHANISSQQCFCSDVCFLVFFIQLLFTNTLLEHVWAEPQLSYTGKKPHLTYALICSVR